MSKEDYEIYKQRVMANKYSLMDIDFNVMIPSFKYKSLEDYYDNAQVVG